MASPIAPSTMRAWQYSRTTSGLEKNLKMITTATLPTPKADQHLVRIHYAALNPIDYKPAEMPGLSQVAIKKPATPGIDYAGVIVKPANGSNLKVGQRVFGVAGNSPLAGGALAEYGVSAEKGTAAVPDTVSEIDCATVGVAGITALQSISPYVKEGSKLFINGGSGGTGVFGIQIAKAIGCHVTTTCSAANVDLCKRLGADEVVDYRRENVVEVLKSKPNKFDHVVDNIGGGEELPWHCHEFLKPDGVYVMVGGGGSLKNLPSNLKRRLLPGFLGGVKGNVVGFWPQPKMEDLQKIGDWMQEGKVKAVIDENFEFEKAPEAIGKLKTGRAKGKIVVAVLPEEANKTTA